MKIKILAFMSSLLLWAVNAEASEISVVTWNLEHLTEVDGKGCRPRSEEEYRALAAFAASMKADIVAVQEVENDSALKRVFPSNEWNTVVADQKMESGTNCKNSNNKITPQLTGFAIRKTMKFEHLKDLKLDVTSRLRNATQVKIYPANSAPIYLLSVHLKSGCSDKPKNSNIDACKSLQKQIPLLEQWIDARASSQERFIILGDFNRRLNKANDWVWQEIDDSQPNDFSDLVRATESLSGCDSKYPELIDHIVTDKYTGLGIEQSRVVKYQSSKFLSDHCPVLSNINIASSDLLSPPLEIERFSNLVETIAPMSTTTLRGAELRSYLKRVYFDGKHRSLGYNTARILMYSEIDVTNGSVKDVYAGFIKPSARVTFLEPINAEHTIPQSWFGKREPMKSDIHHLFPTHKDVNSTRGNKPFSDIDDSRTEKWFWSTNNQLLVSTSKPSQNTDFYSENINSYFEPPENHKGNVARAAAYFYTVYPEYAKDLIKLFGPKPLETIKRWNEQDPVDDDERRRNRLIEKHQGNSNPYIEDSALVCLAWGC